ncbi:thiol reductant ABC exporter subunit CydD [Sphingosinicellaceae bacterium]|nr:thiol reductant ABC exporter subunit CydD [Sphingosinicellaceae bacterium]
MTSLAIAVPAAANPARARRAFLTAAVGDGGRTRSSTVLLMLDSVAAIGFAGGLAQAVVAVPSGVAAMLPWTALILLAAGTRGLCAMLSARTGADGARQAKLRLRQRIVGGVFRDDGAARATTGALMTTVVDEVEALDGYVARFLPARHAAALAPLLVLAVVALASPVAAAILVATLVPFVIGMILAGSAAADESRRQFEALARLSGQFADRIRALPVILAFRAEDRETASLGVAADAVAARTMKVLRIAFLSSGALEFFAALSVALVAVYCGFSLLGILPFAAPEQLDLARAFFVLALAPEFYAPMRRLAAAYHDRQSADTAAERLQSFGTSTRMPGRAVSLEPAELVFDGVTIRYPGSVDAAVNDVSLVIPAGQVVALVGPSGSGKSSLLNLLLGLAPLTGGRVGFGGVDLAEAGDFAGVAAWAGQVSLILPASIRDNIALARPDAGEPDIAAAVRGAGLGPMLAARRHGLDTLLDARGSGLSGGERRRIALARALLKPAPLLLLDEPTAHLDAEAETALIATIHRACAGRTVLIATHSDRLAAIADVVVRLGGAR